MDINLRLPIFFNGEDVKSRLSMGIEIPLSECFTVDVVFYSINAISLYAEDGEDMTMIHSNGDDFLCSMLMEKVEGLIAQSLLNNKYLV